MGEVWLAEAAGAAGFSKRVVIKTLRSELTADPRLIEQFVAEGQLLEQLDHPNIAQILDLGHADDTWFLAMEYVEGFDLRALLRAHAADGVGEIAALCVLAAATRALEHAASRRGQDGQPLAIIHHDVTPSNLMVRRDGHVKLVDFGVARSAIRVHLEPGALRGKLPYLAPEQVRAADAVDARADLFSLGLVAVELLTGERAMKVADPSGLEVAWELLPDRVRRLCANLAPETTDLVARLTALSPSARPDSAAAVNEAIRARLATLAVSDIERPVAASMAPAFSRLEVEAGGFSQTLGALVSAGARAADNATGTVSLPGLSDLGRVVPPPALTSPSRDKPRDETRSTVSQADSEDAPATQVAAETADDAAPSAGTPGSTGREVSTSPVLGLAADSVLAAPAGRPSGPLGLKRRVWFALLSLLMVATSIGWWLGGRDPIRVAPSPAPPDVERPAAPPNATIRDAGSTAASPTVDSGALAADTSSIGETSTPDVQPVDTAAEGLDGPPATPPTKTPADSATAKQRRPRTSGATKPRRFRPATTSLPRNTRLIGRRPTPSARIDKRRGSRGKLIFRVLPVDAEVRIDGKVAPIRPADGVYRLTLSAGAHRLEVRDPASGKVQRRIERVMPGVERRVGGFTLVRTLP